MSNQSPPEQPTLVSPPVRAAGTSLESEGTAALTLDATPSQPDSGSAPSRLSYGVRIDGYEILSELGRGGMGIVYKARQVRLNRLVALKMIRSGEYARPEDLIRFLSEAEAVAHIQHPNIVQIYETHQH